MKYQKTEFKTNFRIPLQWHEYKCIFVPIPKTGTSSIDLIINRPHSDNGHPDIIEIKGKLSPEEFKSYFKFSFVRNPWDRAVSIFINRPQFHGHTNFLDFIKSYTLASQYCRWPSPKKYQRDWLVDEDDNIIVDFIGRFENLVEDFNTVCDKIGIQRSEFPHENNRDSKKHYTTYYNKETIEIIRERFDKDIEYFGYNFENNP